MAPAPMERGGKAEVGAGESHDHHLLSIKRAHTSFFTTEEKRESDICSKFNI